MILASLGIEPAEGGIERVVVLPEPVGPVTSRMPGALRSDRKLPAYPGFQPISRLK